MTVIIMSLTLFLSEGRICQVAKQLGSMLAVITMER